MGWKMVYNLMGTEKSSLSLKTPCHAGIQKVFSEGVQFFFSKWVDPNTTEIGLSSARQQNAIKMAFRWRGNDVPDIEYWLGSFVIFKGIWTLLLRNPIIL